jgi:CHAD domain-containing protein
MSAAEEFNPAQSGTVNARRIFHYQISNARRRLKDNKVSDEDIHAARKNIKAARTALRLLRDALPVEVYRRYNRVVRDTARPLSRVRDSRARIEALHALLRNGKAAKYRRAFGKLDSTLHREWAETKLNALKNPRGLEHVRQLLGLLYKEASQWPIGRHDWAVVGRGLERVYAHGRRRLAKSRAQPTVKCLHEWRKQAKYLHYQLKFMEPLWRKPIKEIAHQLHALTDDLGEIHDLEALAKKAMEYPEDFSRSAKRGVLLRLIRTSQATLRNKSLALGNLIYCEKPARFAARIGAYWHEWKN